MPGLLKLVCPKSCVCVSACLPTHVSKQTEKKALNVAVYELLKVALLTNCFGRG